MPASEYLEINDIEFAAEKPETDYIEKLFISGIVIGNENGFELEKTINRADTAEVISRMTAHTRKRLVMEPIAR